MPYSSTYALQARLRDEAIEIGERREALLEAYIRRRSHECEVFAEYERRIGRAVSPAVVDAAAASAGSVELGARLRSALDMMTTAVAAEHQV